MVFLAALWSRLSGWVIAVGAVIAALGAVFLAGRRQGQKEAEVDRLQATNEALRRADAAGAQYRGEGGARGSLQRGDF